MTEVLVIEDDRDIAEAVEYTLKQEGFSVTKSHDGINGVRLAENKLPALILLDLMLPGIDGLEICRRLKKNEKTTRIPIIMLTAKGEEVDKVVGLEMGADDYIVKPFGMKELVARIHAVLRRYEKKGAQPKSALKFKDLEIDADKHTVVASGKSVELTAKEFQLLYQLAASPGRVFSRDQLLSAVWGITAEIETRTIDVHMRRLREKLGRAGKHLETLRGVGYKFV